MIALQEAGKSLDPHAVGDAASMRLLDNLHATLFRYTETYGEVEPDLVETHTVSDDGLEWTFTLREGLRFHTGRPVTAADVRFSLERIRSSGARAGHLGPVVDIHVDDDRTFRIVLEDPFAPLLTYLAYPVNAIVDRREVSNHGGRIDAGIDPGCGPFRLVEWRRGDRLVLDRFDDYHVAGRPVVDRLVYRPIADGTARTTALRTGEIDLVLDVPIADIDRLRESDGVEVVSVPGTFWEYVGLNCREPPFDDAKIRRAVAWGIDRAEIERFVKMGNATVLPGGPIPPGHWAHADAEVYPRRDVERARELLASAGRADGFATTIRVVSDNEGQRAAAQVVKQQLADVGIDVTIEVLESGVFYDALGRGEFAMTLVGWVGFVDPDEWFYDLHHSEGSFNQQGYADSETDASIERGRRTADRAERAAIYAEIQEGIARDAPMVFLYANDLVSAYRDALEGYVVHPTATTLFLRDANVR